MKVMTFNLKDDGLKLFSNWKIRLEGFVELIKKENPDIIGTQEMTFKAKKQLEILLNKNDLNYKLYGESRKRTDKVFDEYNIIMVKDNIEVIDSYTYSLSDTPMEALSKFPNDKFPRILTYIETKDYYVYNTHLTNKVDKNKFLQLDCIGKLLKRDKPIIFTGDFNLGVNRLSEFCRRNDLIDTTKSVGNTYISKKCQYHLDHILTDKGVLFENAVKYTDKFKKKCLSDHYPVCVDINIVKKSKSVKKTI